MSQWTWISASQIGTSHIRTGQRLQDAYSCFGVLVGDRNFFVGIVSDGAGSAELGGQGASLVCRNIAKFVRSHLSTLKILPSGSIIEEWIDRVRDLIYNVAKLRGKDARDFACTLICVISDGDSSIVAHVGDGCLVAREHASELWFAPSWPDHGEYASTTSFLTDQPTVSLRISSIDIRVDVLALFTDGIERLVLDFSEKIPSSKFFNAIADPVLRSTVPMGKDAALSFQLKRYLGDEQVTARTDDDKTLVVAVLR
ncbi:protein phosphatase 2C domain-containing protein [Achromobacter spanius]|uniref:Protein phosphatase 2C domain-containing protein n=1 Tax=Achromobacter spanius TaxID=217203 RepID=A0A2S5GR75_9BURK|nr:PP2C family serine/threonine-protein phosphatase [Achromobacter spanius]PPA75607.1 protein phosphatase 2C domain-containing protein [Achromobacter spanius]